MATFQPEIEAWASYGVPGEHPLKNVGPAAFCATQPGKQAHYGDLWTGREKSGIQPGLRLLVDNRIPCLCLGDLDPETAREIDHRAHTGVILTRRDYLSMRDRHPEVEPEEFDILRDVIRDGDIVLDYEDQQKAFVCYESGETRGNYVADLEIAEGSHSLRCADFRRESARYLQRKRSNGWIARHQKTLT